jgi:transcriptional regulator with XRE-family HTH domain
LQYQRQLRGWSLKRVADEISTLCIQRSGKRPGINGNMVDEWERGVKKPSPFYQEMLCLLLWRGLAVTQRSWQLAGHGDSQLPTRFWAAAIEAEAESGIGNLRSCQMRWILPMASSISRTSRRPGSASMERYYLPCVEPAPLGSLNQRFKKRGTV